VRYGSGKPSNLEKDGNICDLLNDLLAGLPDKPIEELLEELLEDLLRDMPCVLSCLLSCVLPCELLPVLGCGFFRDLFDNIIYYNIIYYNII
jgi:hypothetical protein